MAEGREKLAGVDDGEFVRASVDLSAARQRAERVLRQVAPGASVEIAETLARDVVVLADRVKAAEKERDDLRRKLAREQARKRHWREEAER